MPRLRDVLGSHDIRPKKSLGQHFLVDPVYLRKIVEAAEVSPDDLVLEIGPGTGTLTELLLARAGHVVAVELDRSMIDVLSEQTAGAQNLTLVQGDILEVDLGALLEPWLDAFQRFKVVANLPYYVTSAILRLLLEAPVKPSLIVVTVQLEVARRICAQPGDMSLLSVAVQWYAKPRIVTRVPAGAFLPAPKVDSAVLRLDVRTQPVSEIPDEKLFFRVVRAGFSQRRKQLRNSLSAGLRLQAADVDERMRAVGVDPKRRAETLSLEEWAAIAREYAKARD